jgi:hypothetical protein
MFDVVMMVTGVAIVVFVVLLLIGE